MLSKHALQFHSLLEYVNEKVVLHWMFKVWK
jgi:hypothetical protein